MTDELPRGWIARPLSELSEINPRHPSTVEPSTLVSFVPMPCLSESSPDIGPTEDRPLGDVRTGYTHFADGDVLFAKITPCMENGKGAVARGLTNGMGCGTTELHVIRPTGALDPDYLYRFLHQQQVRRDAAEIFTGSAGQLRVPVSFIKELPFPLPPLTEQRRIVAALDAILGKVAACQARLAKIPTLLKRFRQSILAAACSGRLTADWRESVDTQESAEDLQQRIAVYHRECWEGDQLTRMVAKDALPKNDKWKTAYIAPTFQPNDEMRELPEGWHWNRIGLLGLDPLNTVQTGPFGAQLHNTEFTPAGVPVIAVGNLTGMGFEEKGLYFVSKQKAEQLSRYDVRSGDVLFARSGATLGKVCVAPKVVNDWRMTGHILRVRLNTRFVLPEMVVYALHGDPSVRHQVNGNIRGITRPGFNTALLESIAVPVGPISEQHEIVRRVNQLFAFADKLESRYKTGQAHVDNITQAVLAKAFRGELVPTEHELAAREGRNFEPASALLERIKSTSNGDTTATRRPRTKRATRRES